MLWWILGAVGLFMVVCLASYIADPPEDIPGSRPSRKDGNGRLEPANAPIDAAERERLRKREWNRKHDPVRAAEEDAAEALMAFIEAQEDCDRISRCPCSGEASLLMAERDGGAIRLASYRMKPEFEISTVARLPISSIVSFGLSTRESVERTMQRTVTPVAMPEKKSAVARGLVGGALLGPAGMVVGALSAVSPESKIVEHSSYSPHQMTRHHQVLTIAANDGGPKVYVLEMERGGDADAWHHWLVAAQSLGTARVQN